VLALSAGAASAAEPIPDTPLFAIAPGPFIFGNDDGPANERPRQLLEGEGFAINRTEVTNEQYRRFIETTGHRPAFYADHPLLGLAQHPVVGVDWYDAQAFCAHYGMQRPTEQQFERAARGRDGAPFPWGTAPLTPERANGGAESCCAEDDSDGYAMTAPADAFASGASSEGALNLIGNVWEWARDAYAPYGELAEPGARAEFRVLRGGAGNSNPAHLSSPYGLAFDPGFRFAAKGGFRCVRSPQ